MELKVDTGAKCNVMKLDMLKNINKNKQINRSKVVKLVVYGNDTFSTLGTAELLGIQDMLRLNLVKLDNEVHEIKPKPEQTTSELTAYADPFEDQLGKLPVSA